MARAGANAGAELLERGRELGAIGSALQGAARGEGTALLVGGPPGIGKTALLQAAKRLAEAQGMAVVSARGHELESHFPYGVARQLFEPALRRLDAEEASELLAGPAQMALPVLNLPPHLGGGKRPLGAHHGGHAKRSEPPAATSPARQEPRHGGGPRQPPALGGLAQGACGPGAAEEEPPALEGGRTANAQSALARAYGLYWLVANLSQRCPHLVLVDDLHWADTASARFLLFLSRRLEGLALALVVAARTDDRGAVLAGGAGLAAEPQVGLLQPAPLSQDALGAIVASGLGRAPGQAFTAACRDVTGGSPFLVHQLVEALASRHVVPTDDNAVVVGALGPLAVAQGALACSGRGGRALARAVAVLASEASLPLAARLSGLDPGPALEALDMLVAGHVLRAGPQLDFVHPIVRSAVYEEIPRGERSSLHLKAASLLSCEGADKDAVAAQLLASEPSGSRAVAAALADAAASALERAAPDDAVAYLSRALKEGGGREARAKLLFELGQAEKLAGQPLAATHFREAHRLAEGASLRNRAAFELAGVLAMAGQWAAPIKLAEEAARDSLKGPQS